MVQFWQTQVPHMLISPEKKANKMPRGPRTGTLVFLSDFFKWNWYTRSLHV